jgi:hypothetical protein
MEGYRGAARLVLALLQLLSEYRTGFPIQDREIAMSEEDATKKMRRRNAGLKAAETKGPEERKREGLMAAWTRQHGKDDAANPYSKQNYHQSP